MCVRVCIDLSPEFPAEKNQRSLSPDPGARRTHASMDHEAEAKVMPEVAVLNPPPLSPMLT